MRNVFILILSVFCVAACCNCKPEPTVSQNAKLIVPPNIGKTEVCKTCIAPK